MRGNIILLLLLANILLISSQATLVLSNHAGGIAEGGKYTQYMLPELTQDLKDGENLVFVLTPLSGALELYISKTTNASRDNFNWKATHSGSNIQYINRTDPNYTKGPYYVGAYGLEKSYFHVIAYIDTQDIVLIEREPQLAHIIPGKFQYFKYNLPVNTSFQVSVTPLNGDPDIYVKIGARPTREDSTWRSAAFGIDVLFIQNTEANFKFGVDYFFGVYGWTDSLFSITATREDSTEVLTEGIPHGKMVKSSWPHAYSYFEYRLTNLHDLFFEARPAVGGDTPHLCISTNPNPTIEKNDCMWTSYCCDHGKTDITILKTDPKYKPDGIYYVGLTGHSYEENADRFVAIVTGTTSEKTLLLVQGVSQKHRGVANSYQWFRFYYGNDEESWSILVRKDSGKVEIYCTNDATNSHPTREKYDWKSPDSGSSKTVTLGFRRGNYETGWYYCSTYSVENSNYTITATTESSSYQLEGGSITYSSAPPSGYYKYFMYDCSQDIVNGTDVTISIHYYTGSGYFYVSSKTPRPSSGEHEWFGYHTLVVSGEYLKKNKPKAIYIAVYGSNERRGFFSIVAHSSTKPIQLIAGSTFNGIVKDGRYVNYRFNNYHVGRIRVHLTVKNPDGDAMMYAASYPSPDANENEYSTSYFGPKTLTIPNPGFSWYYISVQGTSPLNDTQYSIRVTADYERLATWDYPFIDDVAKDEVKYYETEVSRWDSKLIFQTTNIDGWTEMYVLPNDTKPSRTNYLFKSTSSHGNVINFNSSSPHWKTGVWSVAIYGKENSDYFISAQTYVGYILPGQPITGSATFKDPTYYRAAVLRGKHFFLNIKVFHDECVRVYASQDTAYPTRENAKWSGASNPLLQNQVMMAINGSSMNPNRYYMYVTVQSCDQTEKYRSYELTASFEHYPFFLSQESEIIHSQNEYFIEKKPYYLINANKFAGGLHFAVESCTNKPVGYLVYGSSNDKASYPITERNKEFNSVDEKAGFATKVHIVGGQFKEKQIKITLSKTSSETAHLYSIFSSLRAEHPRPQCPMFKSVFNRIVPQQEHGRLYPVAEYTFTVGAVQSPYYPLTYEFHAAEVVEDQSGNYFTSCGIKNSKGNVIFRTVEVDSPKDVELKQFFDISKIYQVNVVIRDKVGITNACIPVRFGEITATIWNTHFSFGGFVFSCLAFGVSIYLIIGMIVKKIVFKSEGINLIPNLEFWKDAPALVIDGIIFLFTCCRRSGPIDSYESKTNDTIDNPFEATEVNNEPRGYGSI